MAVPTDPLMSNQWYLDQSNPELYDLNITGAWAAGFTGAGTRTVIIDNGFDFTHSDLNPNYDQTLDYDFESNTANAFGFSSQPHGTAVAGILGADNNGSGIAGVAFDTSMVGYRTVDAIGNAWLEDVRDALHHSQASAQASVVNMSQGMSNAAGTVFGGMLDQSIVAQIRTEIGDAVTLGRGGLGILLAKSAGNAREINYDVNADMWTNDTRQVVVGAVFDDGNVTNYSSHGAALLVSAFGGPDGFENFDIYTTDRVGSAGYTAGDFTNFSGTSAATPMVAGVMAVMLDANSGLGWRDVQDILANTARHVGSSVGGSLTGYEKDAWEWNGGAKWNGGGMHFSNDYGYGLVDATAASRLAESWFLGGFTAHTSANQSSTFEDDFTGSPVQATSGAGTTFNITEGTSIEVERVRLTVSFSTTYIGDVEIYLISPDGTRTVMVNTSVGGSTSFNGTWVFESQEFRGELSNGTWKVQVIDDFTSDPLFVNDIQLETFGHAPSTSDRYVFTNEYSDYDGVGGHLTNVVDSDGGIDTVNASAVTSASTIRLTNGQLSTIDGVSLLVQNMENAVSGDGNDKLFGNDAANQLFGMRGDDRLSGKKAADTLTGGEGRDALRGGGSADVFDFNAISESGTTKQTADRILDFQHLVDKIDLSTIDASTILANNNTFLWRGTAAFTTSAEGEVRYDLFDQAGTDADHTMVWCDVDADTGVEFAIRLTGLINLSSADFYL